MEKPIRVLIVEDVEDDAMLVVEQLKRGGFEPHFKRVDTAEGMKRALEEGGWDVILADYKMPSFDGLAAFRLVKESREDIPFIIVSGSIGEDIAVEAMKLGVHDYLMKGNLKRLASAVTQEIRNAQVRRERREAEIELKRRVEELEIFHKATVGRELKMIDLEKEINAMLKELGREPKYKEQE
ncbi:MAG: response regulator [Thermoplasmata archaeon]|nr:response regulator [Thermoplasmata archaeon]